MIYGLHVVGVIFLVLFQSVFWKGVLPFNGLYDLFLPIVVCAAVARPLGESLFVVALAGTIMDSMTGGAFGLYLLTYIWALGGVKAVTGFLDKDSLALQLPAVLVAILLENAFFAAAGLLPGRAVAAEGGALFRQLLWALITAPFIMSGWRLVFEALAGRKSLADGGSAAGDLP